MTKIFVPHDYQRESLDHLYHNRRCALLPDLTRVGMGAVRQERRRG